MLESGLELEVASDSIVLDPVMRLDNATMVLVPFGLSGQFIQNVRLHVELELNPDHVNAQVGSSDLIALVWNKNQQIVNQKNVPHGPNGHNSPHVAPLVEMLSKIVVENVKMVTIVSVVQMILSSVT